MDQQLRGVERVRQEAYGALQTQVTTLSERAGSLTNALRTPHVRGRWGEAQLRNVVEYAGMIEHCDFVSQATTSTEDSTLRPDLVVRIPGGKHVVVDAKAPLAAYLDAFETSDEAERERHLADHARQVREHVTKLSAKGYWRQFEPSPDFVVMFLPDESYLRVAHGKDPGLQEYAWSSNVILASPSTLMGLLRTVAMTWQQETVAESAREVGELGRELYKRLSTMGAHVGRLGKSLDGAVKAYNETVGSLERQVLVQARRFEQHGITGIEPPELQPIQRQARPLAAAELLQGVDADAVDSVDSEPPAHVAGADAA
jgi:DNA recombination protein RmuC